MMNMEAVSQIETVFETATKKQRQSLAGTMACIDELLAMIDGCIASAAGKGSNDELECVEEDRVRNMIYMYIYFLL